MANSGSLLVRRQLGRRLRALREAAHKRRADVVTAKICSHSKLERIEYGQGMVRPGDVRELGTFYGADEETVEALVRLAYATTEPSWWEEYSDSMRPDFALYMTLEATASDFKAFEPEIVHGLLQTAAYARAVERGTRLRPVEAVVDQHVRLRMERQRAVFEYREPLRAEFILGEVTFLKGIDHRIMREQRNHLLAMNRRDHIQIRVLPLSTGITPTLHGAFTVLEFTDPEDPPIAYAESYDGARYPEDPAKVDQYRQRFATIRRMSIPYQEYVS